jgi:hypothetical protein
MYEPGGGGLCRGLEAKNSGHVELDSASGSLFSGRHLVSVRDRMGELMAGVGALRIWNRAVASPGVVYELSSAT